MTEDQQAITIRLPRPLHDQLRRRAFETRKPMSQIVIAAIAKDLGNEDR